ncbi:MAG: hypothetical protein P1S60_16170, partial [Anaerolineae bacterium]|nr:hypothetical protein [Anaerolineae bacterium]
NWLSVFRTGSIYDSRCCLHKILDTTESGDPVRHQPSQLLVYLGMYVTVAIILYLRVRISINTASITWEDGWLFLTDALNYPLTQTLFKPYAGYYHVLPRLFAEVATPNNLLNIPSIYGMISVLFAACVLSLPVLHLFHRFTNLHWRVVWVLTCALVPWPTEILGTITSLHWYAFWGLMLLCLADLSNVRLSWLLVIIPFVVLTIFSSPPAVLLMPLSLFQGCLQRSSKTALLFYASIITLSVALLLFRPGEDSLIATISIGRLIRFVLQTGGFKTVIVPIFGEQFSLGYLGLPVPAMLAEMVVLSVLLLIIIRQLRLSEENGVNRGLLYITVGYCIVAPILLTGLTRSNYIKHFIDDNNYWGANRYYVVPAYLVVFLLLMFIQRGLHVLPSRIRVLAGLALVALYIRPIEQNFLHSTPDVVKYNWRGDVLAYYADVVTLSETDILDKPYKITIYPDDFRQVRLPAPASYSLPERARINDKLIQYTAAKGMPYLP